MYEWTIVIYAINRYWKWTYPEAPGAREEVRDRARKLGTEGLFANCKRVTRFISPSMITDVVIRRRKILGGAK